MKHIIDYFRRIKWKLTLSYAFVTDATVILLAIFLVGLALFIESRSQTRTYDSFYWSKTVFQDNIPYILADPDARRTAPVSVLRCRYPLSGDNPSLAPMRKAVSMNGTSSWR